MTRKRAFLLLLSWLAFITGMHLWVNFDWESFLNDFRPENERKLNVAYIPVTCHLACPVTDFISEHSLDGHLFIPKMFQGFPEIKEALIANRMQAGFVVAPLAIALRAQGVPIKIVYLGHRYGSSVVVQKDGPVKSVKDLVGRTVAIPSRFSDERLIVLKALRENGVDPKSVKLVEMAPPDVAGALAVKAIDAFSMAEPFPTQAEMGGYGRILFQAREYWPDYISCVLIVRQDLIDKRPQAVQVLVDGIARSGLWLEEGKPHREYAADFVGRYYFHQSPEVLRWALTKPLDRVMFEPLSPLRRDFELVQRLMIESGVLEKEMPFEDIVDARFAEAAAHQTSWVFEEGEAR